MSRDLRRIEVGPGISLETRIWSGGHAVPVVCLPGLTRNAADFDGLARKISEAGHNVAAISLRGRGASSWDRDRRHYFPSVYRDDVLKVMDALSWDRAAFIGTSLGGIVTMLANKAAPDRVAGAVINDVGPELAPEGLARIASYAGKDAGPARDLDEAADRIRAINAVAFPDEDDPEFWRAFARRTFRQIPGSHASNSQASAGWAPDYDPGIGAALAENGPAPDLWPAWASLAGTPTLLVHGALSDLLTDAIVAKMRAAHPKCAYARVPRVGHAPMLTEPAASSAIERFLSGIA